MEIAEDKSFSITWGAAAAAAVSLIGVVLWLSSVDSKANDSLQRLDRQKDAIHEMRSDITAIRAALSEGEKRDVRMETILNEVNERTKRWLR